MIELTILISIAFILLANIMSWLGGDSSDMERYYRTEYKHEYDRRDKRDPYWYRHLD
jgi:hypothetical protein